jgi:hypothetical protein
MTIPELKRDLLWHQRSFTMLLTFNLESPKRMQYAINETLKYLKSINFEGKLKEKAEKSIEYLNLAHSNAERFSKDLRMDFSSSNDLAAKHTDEMFWYQQVIGTAESAIDVIVHYIDNNE